MTPQDLKHIVEAAIFAASGPIKIEQIQKLFDEEEMPGKEAIRAVIERLQRADIAYGRLNDMAGLSNHPQLRRVTIDTPSGPARLVAVAARRSDESEIMRKVPALGEHSAKIRKEFS